MNNNNENINETKPEPSCSTLNEECQLLLNLLFSTTEKVEQLNLSKPKKKHVGAVIDIVLYSRLKDQAWRSRMNLSQILRKIIEDYLLRELTNNEKI